MSQSEKKWWCLEVRGRFLGRVFATEAEVREAVGPYAEWRGNSADVWGVPTVRVRGGA